jgi:hypothetical protein
MTQWNGQGASAQKITPPLSTSGQPVEAAIISPQVCVGISDYPTAGCVDYIVVVIIIISLVTLVDLADLSYSGEEERSNSPVSSPHNGGHGGMNGDEGRFYTHGKIFLVQTHISCIHGYVMDSHDC